MYFHGLLHAHELWIVALSAVLVALGGWMELTARRTRHHGFPWLYAISVGCFFANLAIILVHRVAG